MNTEKPAVSGDFFGKGKMETCSNAVDISKLNAEGEQCIESLVAHLSEQRHDFFNLLQVLYGYTQLGKPEKVLMYINNYREHMENIGRLYNSKCIKLADLLYTKSKEAESIDIVLKISVSVSTGPAVRVLDGTAVLNAVDNAISCFLYILHANNCKNSHLIFELRENEDGFRIEIHIKELGEGRLVPMDFKFPGKAFYWTKIERDVISFDVITDYCSSNGLCGRMLENGTTFVLDIRKES